MRGFASDNNSGIHPSILSAIIEANENHTVGYGDDPYTKRAIEIFKEHFGSNTEIYFVFNGTGANILGLMQTTHSYSSIICAKTAHINVDECGAPERIAGVKLIDVEHSNGKITPEAILPYLNNFGDEHHSQPGAISISQVTEMGTVYTPEEIRALADLAHQHNMILHLDGARIANAAATLNLPFKAFTVDCGVDVVSFGGTKNGMMLGEAVLVFNPELTKGFEFRRKQTMQLFSKMRFVGAQFIAYFHDQLWLENARHSNEMAKILASEVSQLPQIKITVPVEANGIFATIPTAWIEPLQEQFYFYTWDEQKSEVRWMCSFDTTKKDIENFVALLKEFANRG
ncbi:MAG: low specificity L-threonine aldolase [Salinivirgaceae bacterium]|nr:low specificity L-threonine aldolase [Salinivirgaceae bacterium]MDD4747411.1 low specificity L-threonine aldolase [Salinivirgaceae bacterium]MDY0280218.1 low specificity L-threonine aldolase [Salinivirgaceae bacterium]